MLQLVISSVRHNLGRYLATLIAIMTGVGFYTAVGVVSDGVISSLEGNVDAEYGNVDVAVVPDENATADETAADPGGPQGSRKRPSTSSSPSRASTAAPAS